MFIHNEGLAIPSSGATLRVTKRHRQEPVVSEQHKRKTFTRSQRESYDDGCAYLSYSDEAMWSQLKPATMPMPLPRGCRALMLELFGLMALTVTAAQLGWSVTRGFNEAMKSSDWTTDKLKTIGEQIDRDDPFCLVLDRMWTQIPQRSEVLEAWMT